MLSTQTGLMLLHKGFQSLIWSCQFWLCLSGFSWFIYLFERLKMFNDYSTILMSIEKRVKNLGEMCLNKRYEGYASEITSIQSELTLLAAWISAEQERESKELT
jgi:hypothetical protein